MIDQNLRAVVAMQAALRNADPDTNYMFSTACDLQGAMSHSKTQFARFDIVSIGAVTGAGGGKAVRETNTLIANLRTWRFMGKVITYTTDEEFRREQSRKLISGLLVTALIYDDEFFVEWAKCCVAFAEQRVV